MSEVAAPAANTDVAVIDQKRKAWGNMGVAIHQSEMELQARAQSAILKITLPATIEDVPAHETLLKELRADQVSIETDRKKITSKFNDLFTRLMQPEKSLNDPIKGLSDEIIKVKKVYEDEQRKSHAKMYELKKAKEKVINYVANIHADFMTKISNMVGEMYAYALGAGDITPAALPEYMEKLKGRLSIFDFQPKKPFVAAMIADQESIDAVVKANFNPMPAADYVEFYLDQLLDRFSDYDVAFNNKVEAVRLATQQANERNQEIEQQKNNTNLAAKLDNISTEIVTGPVVKALRKAYKVQMDETPTNAINIMRAFVVNYSLCIEKLRVTKWFSFSIGQMITALEKVKSDDERFQPQGIVFVEVDKL